MPILRMDVSGLDLVYVLEERNLHEKDLSICTRTEEAGADIFFIALFPWSLCPGHTFSCYAEVLCTIPTKAVYIGIVVSARSVLLRGTSSMRVWS